MATMAAMPELPDVTVYVERLRALLTGHELTGLRIGSPFVLRSVEPPPSALVGKALVEVDRIGKRVVLGFGDVSGDAELFAVIHLMIAGRLRWRKPGAALARKRGLVAFDFGETATLLLTEEGSQKRASLHVVSGREGLGDFDRGGLEVTTATREQFIEALTRESHTLKRALTDPRLLSGIGNAYSDEILHRARLSPFKRVRDLDDDELENLHDAVLAVLDEWTERHRTAVGDGFPEKVTAFHADMAVHGRYGETCPVCDAPVQRIQYASNECNYCPRCQTGGKVLADRVLSRLLKDDWPRTLDELEELRGGG